jgi:hypothetical protein
VTSDASLGPVSWTVSVYATCPPATSDGVEAVFVIDRATLGPSGALAIALLLFGSGSMVELPTVAVLTTPTVSELSSRATIVKACESPTASEGAVHVTVPPANVQPALADVKPSPAGSGSETLRSWASSGPALDAFNVNVSSVPGTPGTGDADLVSDRSAVGAIVITGRPCCWRDWSPGSDSSPTPGRGAAPARCRRS